MAVVRTASLRPGMALPPLVKPPITKLQLLMYSGASGDYNLIHTDVETARARGLGDVIAQGMLSMGFLGQFLSDLGGPECLRRMRVRFVAMVRLGDILTCKGTVMAVDALEHDRAHITLEIWAENQRGLKVTTGEAEIQLPEGSAARTERGRRKTWHALTDE